MTTLLVALAALVWCLPPRVPILFVDGIHGGPYRIAVQPPYLISVEYIHSVEQCLVREEFEVGPRGFLLVACESGSTGAGLPYDGDGFQIADGVYRIEGNGQQFGRLLFGARPFTQHRLCLNGTTALPFCAPGAPDQGHLVSLVVRTLPSWIAPLLAHTPDQRRAGP